MEDHAKAKAKLIEAAIRVAKQVEIKLAFPLDEEEAACIKQLKSAVADFIRVESSRSNKKGK